jgi:hypothetical protein
MDADEQPTASSRTARTWVKSALLMQTHVDAGRFEGSVEMKARQKLWKLNNIVPYEGRSGSCHKGRPPPRMRTKRWATSADNTGVRCAAFMLRYKALFGAWTVAWGHSDT